MDQEHFEAAAANAFVRHLLSLTASSVLKALSIINQRLHVCTCITQMRSYKVALCVQAGGP